MSGTASGFDRARRLAGRLLRFARKRGLRRTASRLREEFDDAASRLWHGRSRYERWFDAQQRESAERLASVDPQAGPLLSILMPVCDPDPRWLAAAIESLRAQRHTRWQLCAVDDASRDPAVSSLLEAAAAGDERIEVARHSERQGISRTSNRALAAARGDYVALLDHDDELTPDALMRVVESARETPFDILYSDEDKLDPRGRLRDPTFKPDRCRDLLHACMYFGHLSVYRTAFLRELGGFDPEFDGSQDYDLALRAEACAGRVVHLPQVLYHWRMAEGSAANPDEDAKPWAYAAGRRALEAAVARVDADARVIDGVGRGHARVQRPVGPGARISVLYCACCGPPAGGAETEVVCEGRLEIEWLAMPGPDAGEGSTIGARWNRAAADATGELLVFLEGVRPRVSSGSASSGVDQVAEIASQLQRPEVGIVGGRICGASGELLHAGVVVGGPEGLRTRLPGLLHDEPGPLALAQSLRRVTAVSGGALAIERATLDSLGGFDPGFRSGLHDVDLCLKLQRAGRHRVIYDPYVDLERAADHFDAARRRVPGFAVDLLAGIEVNDRSRLQDRWAEDLARPDPFSNPGFHLRGAILHPAHRLPHRSPF